jgi:2-phospho-L-lactate guanylyltransferase
MPPEPPPTHWVVVVPVKRLDAAKTRLDRPDRAEVALAMARDTVAAAAACDLVHAVLVVTDDPRAARALAGVADMVADEPGRGLNPALEHGADVARQRWAGCAVAALAADLPALRPAELGRALTLAPGTGRGLVADAAGKGTVLLMAAPAVALDPRFGPDSRAGHRADGVSDLTDLVGGEAPGLRRDVDTVADLVAAAGLGLGVYTGALALGRVQATIRSGTDAVGDDGTVFRLGAGSRLVGSLRQVHPGQRVSLGLAAPIGDEPEVLTIGLVGEN